MPEEHIHSFCAERPKVGLGDGLLGPSGSGAPVGTCGSARPTIDAVRAAETGDDGAKSRPAAPASRKERDAVGEVPVAMFVDRELPLDGGVAFVIASGDEEAGVLRGQYRVEFAENFMLSRGTVPDEAEVAENVDLAYPETKEAL